jgi:hypothetical protein
LGVQASRPRFFVRSGHRFSVPPGSGGHRAEGESRLAAGGHRACRRGLALTERARCQTGERQGSCSTAQRLLFVLVQIIHVEIAMLFEPVLVGLDRERPHQPKATLAIGEDPHHMGAALDLLV